MYFLKFFLEWGKNGLGFLWVPYIALSAWFLYQTITALRSGWRQDAIGVKKEGKEPVSIWKIGAFKLFLALTGFAIIIHIAITLSYKGS
jgi:hypothetical protein